MLIIVKNIESREQTSALELNAKYSIASLLMFLSFFAIKSPYSNGAV